MLKDKVVNVFMVTEDDWQRLDLKGLFPDKSNPEAVKKQEELLARELVEGECDTYDADELLFLGVMSLDKLSKKSRALAYMYMDRY